MALFKKFEGMYGLRWGEQYGTPALIDLAIEEWGKGLYGLSGEQIGAGIDACRLSFEWPPSIAAFVKLAKGPQKDWQHAGLAYKPHVRSLPKPRLSGDIVQKHFSDIRAALRG